MYSLKYLLLLVVVLASCSKKEDLEISINFEKELFPKSFNNITNISITDINNDSYDDLIIMEKVDMTTDKLYILENQKNDEFSLLQELTFFLDTSEYSFSNVYTVSYIKDSEKTYCDILIGRNMVNQKPNKVAGQIIQLQYSENGRYTQNTIYEIRDYGLSALSAADFNNDGLYDILVGGERIIDWGTTKERKMIFNGFVQFLSGNNDNHFVKKWEISGKELGFINYIKSGHFITKDKIDFFLMNSYMDMDAQKQVENQITMFTYNNETDQFAEVWKDNIFTSHSRVHEIEVEDINNDGFSDICLNLKQENEPKDNIILVSNNGNLFTKPFNFIYSTNSKHIYDFCIGKFGKTNYTGFVTIEETEDFLINIFYDTNNKNKFEDKYQYKFQPDLEDARFVTFLGSGDFNNDKLSDIVVVFYSGVEQGSNKSTLIGGNSNIFILKQYSK